MSSTRPKDGDEALDLCKKTHPDIAFVDLHMPKMAGLDVLAHIRALSPKTAVVIITAYGSAANAVEAMKLGAVEFLEKPFDPKVIRLLAEEILFRQRHGIAGVSVRRSDAPGRAGARARGAISRRALISKRPCYATSIGRSRTTGWAICAEEEGDERRAVQYYYMAITADHTL